MTKPCILITGCSSGIGAALARAFHQRGAVVYATARRPDSRGNATRRPSRDHGSRLTEFKRCSLPHAAHAAHKPANATQDAADKRSLPLCLGNLGLVQPFGLFRPAPPDIDRRRDHVPDGNDRTIGSFSQQLALADLYRL